MSFQSSAVVVWWLCLLLQKTPTFSSEQNSCIQLKKTQALELEKTLIQEHFAQGVPLLNRDRRDGTGHRRRRGAGGSGKERRGKKEGGTEVMESSQDEEAQLWIRNETRERLAQAEKRLGTTSDDEILVALLSIHALHKSMTQQVLDGISLQLQKKQQTFDETSTHALLAEEDFTGLEEGEEAWDSEKAEKDDRTLTMLLDLYEQHPSIVQLFEYQRIKTLLDPLMKEWGTSSPRETIHALLRERASGVGSPDEQ